MSLEKTLLKVKYESNIRKRELRHNGDLSYNDLLLKVQSLFEIDPKTSLKLKYRDEDSDMIVLADDEDLLVALSLSSNLYVEAVAENPSPKQEKPKQEIVSNGFPLSDGGERLLNGVHSDFDAKRLENESVNSQPIRENLATIYPSTQEQVNVDSLRNIPLEENKREGTPFNNILGGQPPVPHQQQLNHQQPPTPVQQVPQMPPPTPHGLPQSVPPPQLPPTGQLFQQQPPPISQTQQPGQQQYQPLGGPQIPPPPQQNQQHPGQQTPTPYGLPSKPTPIGGGLMGGPQMPPQGLQHQSPILPPQGIQPPQLQQTQQFPQQPPVSGYGMGYANPPAGASVNPPFSIASPPQGWQPGMPPPNSNFPPTSVPSGNPFARNPPTSAGYSR